MAQSFHKTASQGSSAVQKLDRLTNVHGASIRMLLNKQHANNVLTRVCAQIKVWEQQSCAQRSTIVNKTQMEQVLQFPNYVQKVHIFHQLKPIQTTKANV